VNRPAPGDDGARDQRSKGEETQAAGREVAAIQLRDRRPAIVSPATVFL
jgi:hypothetical protein